MKNLDNKSPNSANKKSSNFKDRVGDVIEKAGHKISDAGAPKLGQKIHDMGDRMEKSHSNPKHPHKV